MEKKEEFFTIFDKCHLSLRSFPVDFLKVDSIIIPYQVFDIRICPIRLQILHMYIDILKYQYANNGNIMRTIESRLLNEEILLKVLYCRSFLIYISWMSKIKTGYFFSKRFRVCIRGKNHLKFRSRCAT